MSQSYEKIDKLKEFTMVSKLSGCEFRNHDKQIGAKIYVPK